MNSTLGRNIHHYMNLGYFKKPKKYRCKICGKWTYQKSDKKNICIECRKKYLNNKSE